MPLPIQKPGLAREADVASSSGAVSVGELVSRVTGLLHGTFSSVTVRGEISNFRRPASGHCYFVLKDDAAQLRCVLWRSSAARLSFQPEDGMLVEAIGRVTVYAQRGDLQLAVEALRLAGEGALQLAFEKLKRRLSEEGLFDSTRKKALPTVPDIVGIITSGTGAALQDILTVLRRRFPHVRVLVCPVRVQGIGAGEEIAAAIERLNAIGRESGRPDVLIVGRGGGSAEDLWAFNEETVARSIFASDIPVVSAVGHETDISIADFVADQRAATPSMAAEIVVPDVEEVRSRIQRDVLRLSGAATGRLRHARLRVLRVLESRRFNRPVERIHQLSQLLDDLTTRLDRGIRVRVESMGTRLEGLVRELHARDPSQPLKRGFARVERNGESIRRASRLEPGDHVQILFEDGVREADISR
jgi:exodeoxyribonuclease VII large subunit